MRIVICGAGEVGSHASEVLDRKGHSITVVDADSKRLAGIEESLDARVLTGNCAQADVLIEAGANGADLVVAATNNDEVNLLCAALAKRIGARKVIARVHEFAYLEQEHLNYDDAFGIDQLICPEYSTAIAIAQALRNPAAMAVESFAGAQIEMQQFKVTSGAKAIGSALADLALPQAARVAAITRGRDVMIPDGGTRIEENDAVLLVGAQSTFDQAFALFHGKNLPRQKVVINGGVSMAAWVCRYLEGRNFAVRIFDRDRARAEALAAELDWVTVLNADPTDAGVFQEERLAEADDFVSLLEDDEDNIIGAVLSKSRGVRQVISVVQRSAYLELLSDIGVDRCFSPRVVAANEIEEILDESPVRRLSSLARGILDVWRVRPGASCELLGKRLRTVKLTPHWSVIAVQRGDETTVPGADDAIELGDTVLVVGRSDKEKDLRALFDAR